MVKKAGTQSMQEERAIDKKSDDQSSNNNQSGKMMSTLTDYPPTDLEKKAICEDLENFANIFFTMKEMRAKQVLFKARQVIEENHQKFLNSFKDNPQLLQAKVKDVLNSNFSDILSQNLNQAQQHIRESIKCARKEMGEANSLIPNTCDANVKNASSSPKKTNLASSEFISESKEQQIGQVQRVCYNNNEKPFNKKDITNEKSARRVVRPKAAKKEISVEQARSKPQWKS